MKVVIYARVSTDDKEQNPERQLMKCRQYCELHDHEIIKELVDYHTGDSDICSRPKGSKIMDYDPEGLIFSSMDRLTRQHPNKTMLLLKFFKDSGITPISATEAAFNLESDFSEVILYIIGYFNNYYLKELRKNVKMGLDRARKEGKTLGRPKDKVNLYAIVRIVNTPEGGSISKIAEELNISRSKAYRSLKEAKQKGLINKGD